MNPEDYEEIPRPLSKRKNTKRWCKGKPGREHDPKVELNRRIFGYALDNNRECGGKSPLGTKVFCYHHVVCTKCGKELKYRPDSCPDLPPGTPIW